MCAFCVQIDGRTSGSCRSTGADTSDGNLYDRKADGHLWLLPFHRGRHRLERGHCLTGDTLGFPARTR